MNKYAKEKEVYCEFISNMLSEHNMIYPEETKYIKNYLMVNA